MKTNASEKKPSVELLRRKKIQVDSMLKAWRKRVASAQRKVRKYRTTKRQYSQKIVELVQKSA